MVLRMQEAEAEADRTYLRDDDGEPFDFWTPLFGKPGSPGISLKLGSGVSLFLRMLEVLTAAFLVATLVAIPIMAKSAQGGVLSGLGYASPNVALSLGNRLPYSVDFWPTQALDILYTVVLMTAIWCIQRSIGSRPKPHISQPISPLYRYIKRSITKTVRLNAPQYPAGLLGYAVRCVQVVGPPVERGLSVKVREAAGVPKAE